MSDINDFSKEISKILETYKSDVMDSLEKAVDDTAKEVVKELKANSPKQTGEYAKGWRAQKSRSTICDRKAVVHNPKHYQRTHLLEKGHAMPNGKGRAKAYPHIAPAADNASEKLYKHFQENLPK